MFARFLFAVLSVAAIMAVSLALVRWRTGKLGPPLVLTVLARVTGGLTLALGSAHLLEIAGGLLIGSRPYTLRNVEVLWIGGILIFSGLSNLAVSGSLRRGESWAWRASGAVTILVWLFTLSLIPVTTGGTMDSTMNRVLFFMHSLYLAYWASHRPKPTVK